MTTFQLARLQLRPGEEQRESLDIAVAPFVLGGLTYSVEGMVPVALTVQRAVSGHVLGLRFAAQVTGPCMRCLGPAVEEVVVDAREYDADEPDRERELQSDYVTEGLLDVSGWVRDQIAFVLPEQILCRPDCAGLCAVCGRDLNLEPHLHEEYAPDPRWSALETLRDPE